MQTTALRPHTVLGRHGYGGDVHALAMTDGDFAGIVFSYTNVSFKEENLDNEDKLKIKFEYHVHEVPLALKGYDVDAFEKELGDFLVELLYYGLEKDFLGFIDGEQDRADDSFKPGSQ